MKTRRVPLIIGLVLALGTGVLLLTYLTSLRPSGPVAQTRGVLVAIHDIPARVAADPNLFSLEQRSASQLDSDVIGDPKDLAGAFTLVPIPAGSVATRSRLGSASASAVPARLAVGMRAVSIAIDNIKGVAGLITPGDRVDVIAIPAHSGDGAPRGYAILRDALVLAMGSILQTNTAPDGGALGTIPLALTTITLALTPSQVDLIEGADLSSTLRFALRNPSERPGAFPVETLALAAAGGTAPTAEQVIPVPALPALSAEPAAASATEAPGVMVIDGDKVSSGAPAAP